MKQSEQDLRKVMTNTLEKVQYKASFDSVWDAHSRKGTLRIKAKRRALVPLIAIFTLLLCFTVGYAGLSRLTDDIGLPFVDDPQVIGKWEAVDFVNEMEDFNPAAKTFSQELYLNELVFVKDGSMLNRVENTALCYASTTWTKGFVLSAQMKTASKYIMKDMDGVTYMFFEWKSGDYIKRFMKPKYYVLKQIDHEDYSDFVAPRIEDKIDYPFVNNPEMIGKWESIDFVRTIGGFDPQKRVYEDELYLKGIDIEEEGKLALGFADGPYSNDLTWTNDLIINQRGKTASRCTIKTISGETYMFMEWKSGDYVFRGMQPEYYVLKKVQ